jgi:tripartite-type tricarboxylate transporter receptor subunit TctC
MFQYTPDVAVVNADSDVKAPRDLVDAAKAALKRVIFSDSGEGSANLPAEVQFDTLAGAQTTYVSFKYTGAAVTALQGNQFAEEWRYRTVGADQGDKVCILPVAMKKTPSSRVSDLPTPGIGFEAKFDLIRVLRSVTET